MSVFHAPVINRLEPEAVVVVFNKEYTIQPLLKSKVITYVPDKRWYMAYDYLRTGNLSQMKPARVMDPLSLCLPHILKNIPDTLQPQEAKLRLIGALLETVTFPPGGVALDTLISYHWFYYCYAKDTDITHDTPTVRVTPRPLPQVKKDHIFRIAEPTKITSDALHYYDLTDESDSVVNTMVEHVLSYDIDFILFTKLPLSDTYITLPSGEKHYYVSNCLHEEDV